MKPTFALPKARHCAVHGRPLLLSSNTKKNPTSLFIYHSFLVCSLHECFDSLKAKILQNVLSPSRTLAPKETKLGNKKGSSDGPRWDRPCSVGSALHGRKPVSLLSSLPFHLPSLYSQHSLLKPRNVPCTNAKSNFGIDSSNPHFNFSSAETATNLFSSGW